MSFYCGNNYFAMGNTPLGTPYECMKRGVGAGLHGDLTNFSPRYQPIFPNNKYCGRGTPPLGKVQGRPHECLSKGYGVGLKLQYERQRGYLFGSRATTGVSGIQTWVWPVVVAILIIIFVQLVFKEFLLTLVIIIIAFSIFGLTRIFR